MMAAARSAITPAIAMVPTMVALTTVSLETPGGRLLNIASSPVILGY